MDGVVKQSITNLCFVDVARLRIMNPKMHVIPMDVSAVPQIRVQIGYLIS